MVNDQIPTLDIGYKESVKPLVLVVDDENTIQSVIFDCLDGLYRLISGFNGREGVMKALHSKPDLILMDVMMPDMSGYDAVRTLQSDPVTCKIPVIIMTAQNFDSSTIQLLKQEPNVYNFLQKPFRKTELRNIIVKTLEAAADKNR